MMTTIEALLDQLQTEVLPGALPRQVAVGVFWTAVAMDFDPPRCGLASTLQRHTHHEGPPLPEAGRLLEHSGLELASWLLSSDLLRAGIGMAAYNALLDVDEAACVEVNAEELIVQQGAGRRVAIVGHFPFVERVRQTANDCWVLELHPRPGDLAAERAAEILPRADVVALTGTSLLNHTFDDLIAMCRPEAFVVLLGASAPLSPILLERGVDAISGTRVVDVPAVLRAVVEGATFRQIPGKRLLTMTR
jgi:uncharacterized protein (DUF4213/DUF364 family)